MSTRNIALVISPSRDEAKRAAHELAELLSAQGFQLFTTSDVSISGVANVKVDSLQILKLQLRSAVMEQYCEQQKSLCHVIFHYWASI